MCHSDTQKLEAVMNAGSRDFIDSANCNSRRLLAMARQCRLSGGFLVLAALLSLVWICSRSVCCCDVELCRMRFAAKVC